MIKHTPGPWEVLATDRGYIITAKAGMYDAALVRNVGNEDNEANARLIAAAPELLEAARSMTRVVKIVESQCRIIAMRAELDVCGQGAFGIRVKDDPLAREWQALDKELCDILDANQAAIAKATGE